MKRRLAHPEILEQRIVLSAETMVAETAEFTEFLVNSTLHNMQALPDVATSEDRFVVTWASNDQDASGWGVYGQIFDSVGTKVGTEFLISETVSRSQITPTVDMSANGAFVVSWGSQNETGWQIYVRHFDGDGAPVTDEILVSADVLDVNPRPRNTDVAILADSTFVVAWEGADPGEPSASPPVGHDIYIRKFDLTGEPLTSTIRVNDRREGDQQNVRVEAAPSGFAVVWDDQSKTRADSIRLRQFDFGAHPLRNTITVSALNGHHKEPSLAVAPDGEILVAWDIGPADSGLEWDVVAARFDPKGNPLGNEILVTPDEVGLQHRPAVTYVDDGFVIAYEGRGVSDSYGIRSRPFASDGTPLANSRLVNSTTSAIQRNAAVASAGAGHVVVWDFNGDGDQMGVFASIAGELSGSPSPTIRLVEETNFEVTRIESVAIPDGHSELSFTVSGLFFDTSDEFVNDAFEAALIGDDGRSLVHTFASDRDAFFNLTEGEEAALSPDASFDGQTVRLDLSGVQTGRVNLELRLVNNDADTTTSVEISDIHVAMILASQQETNGTEAIERFPQRAASETDFSHLSDVSASIRSEYGRTSHDARSSVLHIDVAARNTGQFSVDSPLLLGIANISDPNVLPRRIDGITPEGLPYYDVSALVRDGTLEPSESTEVGTISFFNPTSTQFSYEPVFLGGLNRNPTITTTPVVEAIVNKPYSYDVDATDPDNDELSYELALGPGKMQIEQSTGLIVWNTTDADLGSHSVLVLVADGRGGRAEQKVTVVATEPPPNRPPIFTSTPVVKANLNSPYTYDADAIDPDNDALTYSLLRAPRGALIDPNTGVVTWTPTLAPTAATGLPAVAGFTVEPYASLVGPVGLVFDAHRTLYVGKDNGRLPIEPQSRIRRISADGEVLEELGDDVIEDPDALAIDVDGRFSGVAGSVLVGGQDAGSNSIRAVLDSGEITIVDGPTDDYENPSRLVVDSTGRLLFTASNGLFAREDDQVVRLDPPGVDGIDPWALDVDPNGLIYILDIDTNGTSTPADDQRRIVVLNSDATAVLDSFGTGLPPSQVHPGENPFPLLSHLAIRPSDSCREQEIFLIHNGELLVYDESGIGRVIGSGFKDASSMVFGPDGSLYIALFNGQDSIVKLTPDELEISILAEDGRGGSATQCFEVRVESEIGNHPPVIISDPVVTVLVQPPPPPEFAPIELTPTAVGSNDSDVFTTLPTEDPGLFGITGSDVRTVNFDTTPDGTPIPSESVLTNEYESIGVLMNGIPVSSDVFEGVASPPNATTSPFTEGILQTFTFTVPVVAVGVINTSPDQDVFEFYSPDGSLIFSTTDQEGLPKNFHVDRFVGARSNNSNLIGSMLLANNTGQIELDELVFEVSRDQLTSNYQYDVHALDADGDSLRYKLMEFPNGMTIDNQTGEITWAVSSLDTGAHNVTVRTEDGRGGFDQQSFVVDVVSEAASPNVDLTIGNLDEGQLSYDRQSLTVSGTITAAVANQGVDAVEDSFNVIFFEDRNLNEEYDAGIDNELGSTIVNGAIEGASAIGVEAELSGKVLFAENRIWAFVDSSDAVQETDETNNLDVHDCLFIPKPGVFDPVVQWHQETFEGFVEPLSNQSYVSPLVIDLDLDGLPEVIVSTFIEGRNPKGILRALDGRDGSEHWTIAEVDGDLPVNYASQLAAGDIDQDGFPEIVAVYRRESGDPVTKLIAFEHDGTHKWTTPDDAVFKRDPDNAAPSIVDLNGDGIPEIVVGAAVLDSSDGAVLWEAEAGGVGNNTWGAASIIADVDLDGVPEIVGGNTVYKRSDDGMYVTMWESTDVSDGFPALGQFDEDEHPEIVVVTNGQVHLLNHDGTSAATPFSIEQGRGGPPTVADIDGDGRAEIGVASANRYYVIRLDDGALVSPEGWSAETQDESSNVTGSSVFDFDGDGKAEILYGDELSLHVFQLNDDKLTSIAQIPKTAGTGLEYPVVADVDGDGDAEIVAVANAALVEPQDINTAVRGVIVLESDSDSWVSTRPIWNQHSYHITNVNDGGTIPTVEEKSWQTHNTYRLNAQPTSAGDPRFAPDLTTSYLRASQDADFVSYTVRIGNGGSQFAPAGISIAFYNENPQRGGSLLGTTQTATKLEPGGFEDVTVEFSADVPSKLWVVADDDGQGRGTVSECNESNNSLDSETDSGQSPAGNIAPSFTSTPAALGTANQLYQYAASASDVDGDPLSFDLVVRPDGMTVQSSTGTVVWVPQPHQVGIHDVVLRVADGQGGAALQAFSIEVAKPNTAPWIVSHPPETISGNFAYQVIAQDSDDDPITFHLSSGPSGMSIDTESGLLTWSAEDFVAGIHHVGIIADDGRGGTDNQSFDLRILAPSGNDPPIITSTPRPRIGLEDQYLYQLLAEDPNDDPLAFSLSTAPIGMTISPVGLVTWTPSREQLGNHDVVVRVEDTSGAAAIQSFSINVVSRTTNSPPRIVSTPLGAATVGQLYGYDAEAIDADGDSLIWDLAGGPDGMSIHPQLGTVRWNPDEDQLGRHSVSLAVTDNFGGRSTQEFQVLVRSLNVPPNIVSTPPTTASVNDDYAYSVQAIDPEEQPLSFSLATGPDGMEIDSTTGLVRWTPVRAQVGRHVIEVIAADPAGGVATQHYMLVVAETTPNGFPVITSSPAPFVIAGETYEYQITATDPDGDPLQFAKLSGPEGLAVDAATGLLTWSTDVDDLGTHIISVGAQDGDLGGSQTYELIVTEANTAPEIESIAAQSVVAGLAFRFDAHVTDADGDQLFYSLDDASLSQGILIDALGRVFWETNADNVGRYTISLNVIDARGAEVSTSFDLDVVPDIVPPNVVAVAIPTTVQAGEPVTVFASATDNVGVVDRSMTFNDEPVALDARGNVTSIDLPAGVYNIQAFATDAAGNVGESEVVTLTIVGIVEDPEAPIVDITSPEGGATVGEPIDIIGTAVDDNLQFYKLEIEPSDGSRVRTEFGRGTAPVENGVLGTLDPTALANGHYRVILTASDGVFESAISLNVEVVGELKVGNFTVSFTDLVIPVSGIPITVTRTYDSLLSNQQDELGFGWRLEFRDTNLQSSVLKSTALEQESGIYHPFREGTRVYVTLPGGKREGFTFRGVTESKFAGAFGFFQPSFEPDPGVTSRLSVPSINLRRNDFGEYYAPVALGTLNYNLEDPNFGGVYLLSTQEGLGYEIDARTGDVNRISDANGNVLTFTDEAIESSAGPRVTFDRDPRGRIVAVRDPMGHTVQYSYDSVGDLVTVIDRDDNTTMYVYDDPRRPHFLTEIIDPLGRQGVRTEYDDQGRLIALHDVNGNPVHLRHDPDNFRETIVDALGHATIFEYDGRGNVVTEVDAMGGLTRRAYNDNNYMVSETVFPSGDDPNDENDGSTTLFEYDGFGNILTETDPLGNVTTFTYTSFTPNYSLADRISGTLPVHLLASTTDALGNTTINEYSGTNLVLTRDAQGNETRFTYDVRGNQTSIVNAGGATIFDYDTVGNLVKQTDVLGNETTFTYDANGNQLSETTTVTGPDGPRTVITRTEYDANGRPIEVIDPMGGITKTVYDELGNQVLAEDALGRQTTFLYDERGQLAGMEFADGTTTSIEYDVLGRRVSSTDREGRKTHFEYDATGRLIATIYPDSTPDDLSDNPTTRTEYDLAGRVVAQIDERKNRTEFEYDKAGRQTVVRDALGNETRTDYDKAGRVVSTTDARGVSTQFVHDALGRQVLTTFADGSTTSADYDELGRVTSQTDQEGNTTNLEYDALGRLTAVVDGLNQRTEYEYDEAGNLVLQTDANGHATAFEYDLLGRRVLTRLPLGQESTVTHDAAGNVTRTTDFSGASISFEYDVNNRLIGKTFPNGDSVDFTYTEGGQQSTATDSRGVTTFDYEERDRLVSRSDPDGTSISYEYDAAGNRTSVTTLSGTTSYTFDALNRIETVTNPDGGAVAYTYDTRGSLVRTDFPNDTVEIRAYDDLNRLQVLEAIGPQGILDRFEYTLDKVGNRVRVDENSGRRVDYEYDEVYRLIGETISDPVNGNRMIGYSYDKVGNRLTRDDSLEGLTEYTYDSNDRLELETLAAEQTRYEYDDNGNTLRKVNDVNGQVMAEYDWDVEGRLIAADTDGDGANDVEYQYNADGIRTASIAAGEETRFLVDANRPFAQVLEEYTPEGVIKVSYVHGLDLISQNRPAETGKSFYHVDGLGSTRALTNSSGIVTDTYIYDAFGRTIGQVGSTGNVYLFAGEQRDLATGLDYLRARYYSPSGGRFYGMDPFAGLLRDPMSLHRFLYANANPANFTDPSGRSIWDSVIAAAIQNASPLVTFSMKIGGNPLSGAFARQVVNILMREQSNAPTAAELFKHYVGSTGSYFDLNDELGSIPTPWQDWIANATSGQTGFIPVLSPYNTGPDDLVNALGHFGVIIRNAGGGKRSFIINDRYTFGDKIVTTAGDQHGFPVRALSSQAQARLNHLVGRLSGRTFSVPGGIEEEFTFVHRTINGTRVKFLLVPQQFLISIGRPFQVSGRFER